MLHSSGLQVDVHTWQVRQILITESCLATCYAIGWVAPLVHVADSHGSGWS